MAVSRWTAELPGQAGPIDVTLPVHLETLLAPTWGIRTASLGIMGISLYQAAALTREHLVSLKRSDDLNAELGARVKLLLAKQREVELLNNELRRQIAARPR